MFTTLYTYRAYLVAGLIVAISVLVFLSTRPQDGLVAGATQEAPLVLAQNFTREGYLLKGHPQLKPDVWYLVHSQNGEDAKAAELAFDENSICVGGKASGVCVPDLFINQRPAAVEGVWEGETLRVIEMNFIQPLE